MTDESENTVSKVFAEVAGYARPYDMSQAIKLMRPSGALATLDLGISGWGVSDGIVLCNQKAGILSRTDRLQDAIAFQEWVQQQKPDNRFGSCQLVRFYLAAADKEKAKDGRYGLWRGKAMTLADRLIEDHPQDANCWSTGIEAYRRSNKPQRAISIALEAMKQEKLRNNPVIKSALIGAYLQDRQFEMATHVAEQAVAAHPQDKALNTLYVNALAQSGQPERALKIVDRMIAADPVDNRLHKARERAVRALGNQ